MRKSAIIFVSGVVFALSLVGCSGGSESKPDPTNVSVKPANALTNTPGNSRINNNSNSVSPSNVDSDASNSRRELKSSTMAAIPAPDESTFTSTMDKSGNFIEVREFKNHPRLLKVERKILGRDSKYSVFLKNGKVVEAPAAKMENFRSLSPVTILEAIGIKVTPETPKDPELKDQKKPE